MSKNSTILLTVMFDLYVSWRQEINTTIFCPYSLKMEAVISVETLMHVDQATRLLEWDGSCSVLNQRY